MTELFKTYLELALGAADAPNATKQIVEKRIPKNLTAYDFDGKIVKVRDLLLTEAVESTALIQTAMHSTVLEGAQPFVCMRQAIPVFSGFKGSTYRVPYGEAGAYAKKVPEGSEVPLNVQDYGYKDFTIYKFGTRPMITDEMISDCMYDVMNLEVQYAGRMVENSLNQEALSIILENSGNEVDTTHSGTAVDERIAIAQAVQANQVDGYLSDVLLCTPDFLSELISTFGTYALGKPDEAVITGRVGAIMGLKIFVCSVEDNSSTYIWQNDTDGDIGAMVLDSKNAGAIAMREDIHLVDVKDPIRGLQGGSVIARFGTNYLNANAACRIER